METVSPHEPPVQMKSPPNALRVTRWDFSGSSGAPRLRRTGSERLIWGFFSTSEVTVPTSSPFMCVTCCISPSLTPSCPTIAYQSN